MTDEQNEIINKCLMLAYSADGTPEMGELAAQAHGLELEYKRVVQGIKSDCQKISAAIYGSHYFDIAQNGDAPYIHFNILLGEDNSASKIVYTSSFDVLLPYAVDCYLLSQPIILKFVSNYSSYNKKVAAVQLKVANKIVKILNGGSAENKQQTLCLAFEQIALTIQHDLGETTINK
jgi:hypothetical protein